MLKRYSFLIPLAMMFLALSVVLYFLHYLIFRDIRHIFIYMVGDLAFLPMEAFLVVVIIERILTRRERQAKLQKLNMVVGAFFSELGNRLLSDLIVAFGNRSEIAHALNITRDWTRDDFRKAADFARHLKVDELCSKSPIPKLVLEQLPLLFQKSRKSLRCLILRHFESGRKYYGRESYTKPR